MVPRPGRIDRTRAFGLLLGLLYCHTAEASEAFTCADRDGRTDLRHQDPPLFCYSVTSSNIGANT